MSYRGCLFVSQEGFEPPTSSPRSQVFYPIELLRVYMRSRLMRFELMTFWLTARCTTTMLQSLTFVLFSCCYCVCITVDTVIINTLHCLCPTTTLTLLLCLYSSADQKLFHEAFFIACFEKIYGKEWEKNRSRVMREWKITAIKNEVAQL